jgi:hypothetical protein
LGFSLYRWVEHLEIVSVNPRSATFLPQLLLVVTATVCGAAVLDVTSVTNNFAIQQITYQIGAATVVQNTEALDVNVVSDSEVKVKSVRIIDGAPIDLTFFNTEGAKVVQVNPQFASISGVGVFDNGVTTTSTSGLQAYADAFAATSTDTDLRNFGFHDYLAPSTATPGVPDLDLLFYRAMNLDDYFLISERWGNSFFEVTALMEDGTPYANANVLRIGGPGGTFGVGYQVGDWNTGYAASGNVPSQAQTLTIFSVAKFFEGTNGIQGPVFGLRIDNDGEADVKIVGISDNTFTDNELNDKVVPEPAAFLMTLAGGAILMFSRKRTRREA